MTDAVPTSDYTYVCLSQLTRKGLMQQFYLICVYAQFITIASNISREQQNMQLHAVRYISTGCSANVSIIIYYIYTDLLVVGDT